MPQAVAPPLPPSNPPVNSRISTVPVVMASPIRVPLTALLMSVSGAKPSARALRCMATMQPSTAMPVARCEATIQACSLVHTVSAPRMI